MNSAFRCRCAAVGSRGGRGNRSGNCYHGAMRPKSIARISLSQVAGIHSGKTERALRTIQNFIGIAVCEQ